ncbi:3'-5' exonuclease [Estrella lausannensis]|uniref:Exonuclease domain-containing protein n=1 Tax=Estrella lausannensis TaxID=483423 RepID=A0A0H5DPT8_9BACT|nr:3'-5' exonuclease [Estrella lausannensis]CRX38043.1 Conserved hypothetical protein [Estrella lausannensis]
MLAVFLDIETTGLDPARHKAIDIAMQAVDLSTLQRKGHYRSVIKHPQEVWELRDPSSTLINGFTYTDLLTGKASPHVKEEIITFFEDHEIVRGHAIFICQNPAFDRSFFSQIVDIPTQESLQWPYHWLDLASMYFALQVQESIEQGKSFPENITLSKNKIAERFNLPPEGQPHKALGGVNHLIECYQALFGIRFS